MGAWAQHSSADERATSSYLAIALASTTNGPCLVAKQSGRSPEGKRYYRRPSRNHHEPTLWLGWPRCRSNSTESGIGPPRLIGTILYPSVACEPVATRHYNRWGQAPSIFWGWASLPPYLHHCITKAVHYCITESVHHCITESVHHSISIPATISNVSLPSNRVGSNL